MGVTLRRGKRGVAQHLLDGAQVGSALEEVRGRRVAQAVGRNIMDAGLRGHLMNHGPHDARVDAPASIPEEERAAAGVSGKLGTASHEPVVESLLRRRAIGNDTFFVALAENAHGQSLAVEGGHVEGADLGDAQTAGVGQLEDRPRAHLRGASVKGLGAGEVHEGARVRLVQGRGQALVRAGAREGGGRVGGQDFLAHRPGGEVANGGSVARDRRAGTPARQRVRQPGTDAALGEGAAELAG